MEAEWGKQVRLSGVLADLPSKTYRSTEELLDEVESATKISN